MPQTKDQRVVGLLSPKAQIQAWEAILCFQQFQLLASQILNDPGDPNDPDTGNSSQYLIPGYLKQATTSKPSLKKVKFEVTPKSKIGKVQPKSTPPKTCIFFSGRLQGMNRKTSVAMAEKYGATVTTNLKKANLVVQGTSPGKLNLQMIEKLDPKVIKEEDFLKLIKEGNPKDRSEASTKRVRAETAKTTAANEGST